MQTPLGDSFLTSKKIYKNTYCMKSTPTWCFLNMLLSTPKHVLKTLSRADATLDNCDRDEMFLCFLKLRQSSTLRPFKWTGHTTNTAQLYKRTREANYLPEKWGFWLDPHPKPIRPIKTSISCKDNSHNVGNQEANVTFGAPVEQIQAREGKESCAPTGLGEI